jgi:uncharacterized protein (TIGR02271 family)
MSNKDDQTMDLKAEKLVAEKDVVESGNVRLKKDVVTETESVDVPVTHEEPVLERHPVEARSAEGEIGEGEINVPLREERVYADKQPYVKEEVSIGKRQVEETQRVTGEVSREEPRLASESDTER